MQHILRIRNWTWLVAWLVCTTATDTVESQNAPRPNILWLVSEDNSPYLGCYGDTFARTPRLDALAAEGVAYDNAFANTPVCAPARSTLITGLYATSLGTHHMRSRNKVPSYVELFPRLLRRAGYYTTNHSKTDYNLVQEPGDAWDAIRRGHYKNRRNGQPFFSVFNIETSHEGQLHGTTVKQEHLERPFKLPPYHPDTPEIRSNWVEYYERLHRMDGEIGARLDELDEAGLADDTIVFYYSDHGGVLTRSKRFLFDTGVHVPLIVRFPKKFSQLAPGKPGSRSDRLVSFVDFAPTVLQLAGIDIPKRFQGHAFLGPTAAPPQDYVYLFRGRMDERYDCQRAVRDKRYKYVCNYLPHRPYGQHIEYLWQMPTTLSWEAAYKAGELNAVQRAFWEKKPPEELYDTETDPWEVNNLAANPAYQETLTRLRQANRAHLLTVRDAGFLPEAEMVERASGDSAYELAQDGISYPLERLLETAELAAKRDPTTIRELVARMADVDAGVRYWAATGCVALGAAAAPALEPLEKLLKDPSVDVRIAAAEALCGLGEAEAGVATLAHALTHPNRFAVLHAAGALDQIGSVAALAVPDLTRIAMTGHGGRDVHKAVSWTLEQLTSPEYGQALRDIRKAHRNKQPASVSRGTPSEGSLDGGLQLPVEGYGYRLVHPERKASWGTDELVLGLRLVAAQFQNLHPGHPDLRIGDLSLERGGETPKHDSHESGRDADILLLAADGKGRAVEEDRFLPYDDTGKREGLYLDLDRNWDLVTLLLDNPHWQQGVDRIYLAAPLTRLLLERAEARRSTLEAPIARAKLERQIEKAKSVLRHWKGHADHFHLRLRCSHRDATHGCDG